MPLLFCTYLLQKPRITTGYMASADTTFVCVTQKQWSVLSVHISTSFTKTMKKKNASKSGTRKGNQKEIMRNDIYKLREILNQRCKK